MIGIRDGDWLFGRMDGNIGMGKPLPILFGDIYDFNPDQVRELQAVGFAQDLAITADGGLMLCANMGSDGNGENVVVFRIDAANGKLCAVGEPVEIVKPSCIMIV